MTLERRRPLPAGRYWADVFPQNKVAFEAFTKVNGDSGALHVEVTEHFPSVPQQDDAGTVSSSPERDFVIFSTIRELVWPDDMMGFSPNIAGAEVTSSADTVQRPPPAPSTVDQISAGLKDATSKVVTIVAVGVVAALLVVVVSSLRKNDRKRNR